MRTMGAGVKKGLSMKLNNNASINLMDEVGRREGDRRRRRRWMLGIERQGVVLSRSRSGSGRHLFGDRFCCGVQQERYIIHYGARIITGAAVRCTVGDHDRGMNPLQLTLVAEQWTDDLNVPTISRQLRSALVNCPITATSVIALVLLMLVKFACFVIG